MGRKSKGLPVKLRQLWLYLMELKKSSLAATFTNWTLFPFLFFHGFSLVSPFTPIFFNITLNIPYKGLLPPKSRRLTISSLKSQV
jgi:hypothetical protein